MCKQCELKPVYEFTNKRKLCKKCFIKWFQKKALYTIRKFKMIKQKDIIGYQAKKSFQDVVLEDVLKMVAGKGDVNIVKKKKLNNTKINKTAISSTIDSEANKIVNTLIYGKPSKLKHALPLEKINNQNIIKPLYLFLDNEVLLYAKLKKLKFKEKKKSGDKISKFIDELEVKHPEVKRAIVNSYLNYH